MAGPSRAEALSFFLRKGTFIWEDTSGSLPLGFCGAGWGGGRIWLCPAASVTSVEPWLL